jgi:hypothetical protein
MSPLRELGTLGVMMTIIGVGLLARAIVIQTGRLKGPLLRSFERYSDTPARYNFTRDLLVYAALLVGGATLLLAQVVTLSTPWSIPTVLLLATAWLAHTLREELESFMPQPRWFARLMRMTTPAERRRIAYAWLNITPAMRKHYNAQDDAFFAWVDLVLLAVVE